MHQDRFCPSHSTRYPHPWTIPLEWLFGCLLFSFPFTMPICVESLVTLIISQWATGSNIRNKFGIVNLCFLHMLTPAVSLVTLIIKMHLFRQRLPWFVPGKTPGTSAFTGWGQSGGQHFTYLCHSSAAQSFSCRWEKTGPFRGYSSPWRRKRCLNWVGRIALQQSLSVPSN